MRGADIHVRGVPEYLPQTGRDERIDLGVQDLPDGLHARARLVIGGGGVRLGPRAGGSISRLGVRLGLSVRFGLGVCFGLDAGLELRIGIQ